VKPLGPKSAASIVNRIIHMYCLHSNWGLKSPSSQSPNQIVFSNTMSRYCCWTVSTSAMQRTLILFTLYDFELRLYQPQLAFPYANVTVTSDGQLWKSVTNLDISCSNAQTWLSSQTHNIWWICSKGKKDWFSGLEASQPSTDKIMGTHVEIRPFLKSKLGAFSGR
jgi:hypothetical protein